MLQSEFQHVLHTNYAPTKVEAQKIRDFCIDPENEIEKHELEISRLEAALDAERRKRDEYQDVVTAHRSLLSPIRQLSPEMLQTIFAHCLSEFAPMHVSKAPLLLGRICKRWREIVYNTAELWSAVHVVVSPRLRLKALEEWLSRSGDHPLRISLFTDREATESTIAPFLDLVIPLSRRWERIALAIPPSLVRYLKLDQLLSGLDDLPRLRSFQLDDFSDVRARLDSIFQNVQTTSVEDLSVNPLGLLELCSEIHHISVHLCPGRFRASLPPFVATSLRELNVDYPAMFSSNPNVLFNFLAPCQNIYKLRLRLSAMDSHLVTLGAPTAFITLPLLECLIVDFIPKSHQLNQSMYSTSLLLDRLVTPNLQRLELDAILDVKGVAVMLTNLITRASCSLRVLSLHLRVDNVDLEPLLRALEYTEDLRELAIDRHGSNIPMHASGTTTHVRDPFLSALAYSNTGRNYCPKLTHLAFTTCDSMELNSLLTLVRSRMNPPTGCASLRVLDLHRSQSQVRRIFHARLLAATLVGSSLLESVAELRKQGLTVLFPDERIKSHTARISALTGTPDQRNPFLQDLFFDSY